MMLRNATLPLIIVVVLLFASCAPKSLAGQNVCIEEHDSIIVYYPEYTS